MPAPVPPQKPKPEPLTPLERLRLLKVPLLMTAVGVLVVLIALLVSRWREKPAEPPIVEAVSPGVSLRHIVLYREGDEYLLSFSLCDDAGREIARPGEVDVRIFSLGKLSVEGGAEFVKETLLLDAKFEVDIGQYRWIDIEGGLLFSKKRLIVPKRLPLSAFSRPPNRGGLGKIALQFRDGKVLTATVYQEKRLLFP